MDTDTEANKPAERTPLTAADILGQLKVAEDSSTVEAQDAPAAGTDEDLVPAPMPLDEIDDLETAIEQDGDDDAQDGDEDGYELPALIPEIENSPEALKKVRNFEKGIRKLVDRAKAKEAELAEMMPRVQQMDQWGQLLADRETVREAFSDLANKLAIHHQLSITDLIGGRNQPPHDPDDDDWEAKGYDSPGEYLAYKQAVADVEAKIAPKLAELEQIREERKKAAERQAFDDFVAREAPKVIKLLDKADNGWKVSREMVAEAITNLPQFSKNPAKAVQMYFSEERAKHYARLGSEGGRRKPDMVSGNRVSGHELPPPGKRTAADILRLNGAI